MFTSWLGRSQPRRPTARPTLLRLEDRTVPATIAGTVYADLNDNGLFDAGDTPIASSPVELRNSGGMVINSATTGPAGTYSFATDNTISPAPTTLQQTATVPLTATGFATTVSIPLFDPALGTLTGVTVELAGQVVGDIQFENVNSAPDTVTAMLQARIDLNRPDNSLLVSTLPTVSVTDTVAAFDGVVDFGGASGRTFLNLAGADTDSTSFPPPASDLALFTGPGSIDLPLTATGLSNATGGSNVFSAFNTSASATVTVTYSYVPSTAIRPGMYTVVQTAQPVGFLDGRESSRGVSGPFVLPGSVGTDTIPVSVELVTDVLADNNFGELLPASLSGFVYADADDDGVFDAGEAPIPGATVTLTGFDDLGNSVNTPTTTSGTGAYSFPNLRPGTYTITETQPAGFFDGRDTQGTPGNSSPGNDVFGSIGLAAGVNGVDNNFGEIAINRAINVVKLTNGTDNDAAPGPVVMVGSTVTFTYVVTNAGNVALGGVTVVDDNGTPGVPADDFTATFVGGNQNENSLLDLTETWTFTASRVATPGQHTNLATATGTAAGGTATDTNPDNHRGAVPAISVVKLTNGTDNDTAPGVIVPVGTTVTFTYVVTNPGDLPLSAVTVTDDNGTAGIPADDFNATFVGGDANTDGVLDLTETWTFTASRIATAGQYTNLATATGTPPPGGGASVSATDPDNHFGAVPAVRLVALTNARNNTTGPGPTPTVGSTVTFIYLVTNPGSVPLSGVTVADDAGTPTDPADDFNPAFAGGDTNGNGLLDLTETWVFSAFRVATAGQYTNTATVTAQPPLGAGPAVTDTDTDTHFGFLPGIAVGAGPGASPQVKLLNADGAVRFTIQAFDPGFLGGVRVAVGDVTGDGVEDIVAGAGPGAGAHVKVFDGATGAEVRSFFAFPGFAGGVFVGAGDIDRDGQADIIVGAGAGAAPHVKVFSGATGAELRSFFAFEAGFAGGVTVAGGDVDGDGRADVVVGAGPGAGPHVKVFDGATNGELRSFFAFGAAFTGGVFVGAGDIDCDGCDELVVGAGAGAGPHVKVFDGATNAELRSFFAFPPESTGGVRVASGELNAEGMADLILGTGTGSEVKALDGMTLNELFDVVAFGADSRGVYVG